MGRHRVTGGARSAAFAALLVLLPGCGGAGQDSAPTTSASVPEPPPATSTVTPAPTTAPPSAPPSAPPAPTTTARVGEAQEAEVISRGDPNRRIVALTFDAGADTGFTADILDTLARAGIRSSFGLTGVWAEDNPDLVRRIVADGHHLINHTWDHSSFTGVSARPAVTGRAARHDQLERTERVLAGLTGRSTKPWFRPPYGDYDASVNADVAAAGYRYNVLWTVDSLGWQGLSPTAIAARCLERAVPGAIYLFHVGQQSQDAAALPAVIAGLRQSGYDFGTVPEVVGT
jgi:peptidoglycan/xylan/chitin deacetylase (PgdA/CDA1 family)